MELRRLGVTDMNVLEALERVPREKFVLKEYLDMAYANQPLPIGLGQTISQPLVVGAMTQALDINDRSNVLEIGTGSGYQAAILARLCRRVYTIERHKPLLDKASAVFKELGIENIIYKHADGTKGWKETSPFDAIIVTAAVEKIPEVLIEQLVDGGIMVVPVEAPRGIGGQKLLRIRKTGDTYETEKIFAVRFVPLVSGLPQ